MTEQSPHTLSVRELGWSVNDTTILDGIDMDVGPGEFVGILGPNGSGKSTFLRCIFRYLVPDTGSIRLNGRDIGLFSLKESARQIAAVLQERNPEFDLTVFECVIMGRTPHKGAFEPENLDDVQLAEEALAKVGLSRQRDRHIRSLSGGELQRTLLARALCQRAAVLLLDEPTNHLDIRYQLEILKLIRNLDIAALAALHDLNLAALFCDRIYVLSEGRVVAAGIPAEVLDERLIREVYGVNTRICRENGLLNIVYLP